MVYMTAEDRDKRANHNMSILIRILEKRGGKPFKVRLNMDDMGGRYVEPPYLFIIRNMRDIINYEGLLGCADKIDGQKKHRTALIESM